MAQHRQRLDQQPIDRIVCIAERRQVDLAIPAEKQLEKSGESISERSGERNVRFGRAPDHARSSVAGSHGRSVSDVSWWAIEICGDYGDGGWSNPRDTSGLAERRRLDLRQAIHNLAGKAGHTPEPKVRGNSSAALPLLPIDCSYLPADVALVLDVGFNAGEIESASSCVDFERDLTTRHEIRE